jgi:hypothetical protein
VRPTVVGLGTMLVGLVLLAVLTVALVVVL